MNRLAILHLPNDERIVLTDAREEFVIRAELQFQNLILNAAKDSDWSTRLHVPKNDRCIWHSLEHGAFLARGDDIAGVGDGERADLHVVAAKELLIVLVHEVFDDEQAANIVKQGVFHGRVELDRIRVAAIVAERVVHLEHLLLTLGGSRLFHGCDVARSLVPLLCAEDARFQVLLSVHFYRIVN